jgi:hypothetical protein
LRRTSTPEQGLTAIQRTEWGFDSKVSLRVIWETEEAFIVDARLQAAHIPNQRIVRILA